MKNPFNPDHDHETDPHPEIHGAIELLVNLHGNTDSFGRQDEIANAIDSVSALCPLCECSFCATLICPHGDEMHLHHDGCPSCAEDIT